MKRQLYPFLLIVVLFPGCIAYQQAPVSVDQAVNKGAVKVVTDSGKEKYDSLSLSDSKYIGYSKKGIASLDSAEIEAVYLIDANQTRQNRNVAIAAGSFGLFFIIVITIAASELGFI